MTHHGKLSTWVGTVGFGLILMWGCSSGSPTDPGGEEIILPRGGKGIGSELLRPSDRCSDYPAGTVATFEDANLETAIRNFFLWDAPPQTSVVLTCKLVLEITTLDVPRWLCACDNQGNVRSLVGIQNLTSLVDLNLPESPVGDLSPLGELTSLEVLSLRRTSSSDISPLSGLTSLIDLELQDNAISDITALRALTRLTNLSLTDNSGLTNIQPLLDNTGFGVGDQVNLIRTGVSCEDVRALQVKGVTVISRHGAVTSECS